MVLAGPSWSNAGAAPEIAAEATGIPWSLNEVGEVPRAMFGVHAVPLTPERVAEWGIESDRKIFQAPEGPPVTETEVPILMECWYDRYQPAWPLTDPQWETWLTEKARTYAEGAKPLDREPILEFWNEPYLNWATNPGVNYDGNHFATKRVAGEPTGPARDGTELAGLVWDAPRQIAVREFSPGRDAIDYLATRFMPKDLAVGDQFTWRDRPFRVEERWWARDTGQPAWWSGPVNRTLYHRMLGPFATALKETNPEVTLIVGWGFHLNQDDWAAWHLLHQPLIDFAHQWMDGYNEHHYGGDTRMVAGTYETAYAYTLGTHGKRLRFYNTEAGGMADPEQPGSFSPSLQGDPVTIARGAYTYMVRDILHLLDVCPDKAWSRYSHESQNTHGGDETAFRLLKPLRGSLIWTETANPHLWMVASVGAEGYCVVLFNDAYQAVETAVTVRAPDGTTLAQGGTEVRAAIVPEVGLRLEESALPTYPSGESWNGQISLAGKEAVRLLFPLKGEMSLAPLRRETQFVSPEILREVSPGTPFTTTIALPADDSSPSAARLRFVQDQGLRWRPQDLRIEVNGEPLAFGQLTDHICEVAVPVGLLREQNEISFSIPPDGKPYRICAVSLILTQ
jgi:hypothetical protein